MEEKYTFEFNVSQLNVILLGLQKLPYEQSAKVISEIKIEAQTQQQEKEKVAKTKK